MNSACTIRRAGTADAQALTRLRLALFRELGRHPLDETDFERHCVEGFESSIGNGTCHAWLAEADGEAVAALALLIYPRLPSPESAAPAEGYIVNVYTAPEWRRKGIASALVYASIEASRRLGFGRVRLHASVEGQPVYSAAGFRSRFDEMELNLG